MKHIAQIVPGLDQTAGAEHQVLRLAAGLRRRGWRVSVVTLSGSGGCAAVELAARDIGFLSLGMRGGLADPRGWLRFHRWLRAQRPDIVHTHLPHATWLARWSRLAAPVPLLIDTVHTTATGGCGRRIGYRISRGLTDCVTAVSEDAARSYRGLGMVDPRRLQTLPNGVDTDRWSPDAAARLEARRALGLGNEFVWIAAGRLVALKDYESLIRAMAGVPKPAVLLIAGQGPLENDLKHLSGLLGLDKRVRFLGYRNDLRAMLHAADAYVLSSHWEGLPLALIEAAACGLPAVATNVPGTRDAVVAGETGFLVPPHAPCSLASAMTALMQLPAEARAAMGDRARRRAIECYRLDAVLDRWESLYSELERVKLPSRAASGAHECEARRGGLEYFRPN